MRGLLQVTFAKTRTEVFEERIRVRGRINFFEKRQTSFYDFKEPSKPQNCLQFLLLKVTALEQPVAGT